MRQNRIRRERYRKMKELLLKEDSFSEGLSLLIDLRMDMINDVVSLFNDLPREFLDMVFWEKWHNHCYSTFAYSVWYLSYIEDFFVNVLISETGVIHLKDNYFEKIGVEYEFIYKEYSQKEFILKSEKIDVDVLSEYFGKVTNQTNNMLRDIKYEDLDTSISDYQVEIAKSLNAHRADDLFDSWKGKRLASVLINELSRDWMQHIDSYEEVLDMLDRLE